MKTIDNRGLPCPQPVINTKKAIDELTIGTVVSLVDNVVARENVLKFARSQGCVAEATEDSGIYRIVISKGDSAPVLATPVQQAAISEASLFLVTSDEFGRGSSDLGQALMKTFFFALGESDSQSNHLVFVNGGVKLACEGSPVLQSLQKLLDAGWEIKACGTCLDFYGLKDKLMLGEITNMYTIVELMQQSGRVVTL